MKQELKHVERLVTEAGRAILGIYRQFDRRETMTKADNSPVTEADLAAHRILVAGLPDILDLPVLSEESAPTSFEERSTWQRYWLVDPLDGTKEFIRGSDEFTVNVALIDRGVSVLGVVHVPVSGVTYSGLADVGSFKDGVPITARKLSEGTVPVVVSSRRHGSEAVERLMERLRGQFGEVKNRHIGSSLKLCLLAEGEADLYPRLAPTCEWDTAAAQAVLEAAGGVVVDLRGDVLRYNQKAELLNPYFLAIGDSSVDWVALMQGD